MNNKKIPVEKISEFENLLKTGNELQNSKPSKAIEYFLNAVEIARAYEDEVRLKEALFEAGVTYHNLGNHLESLKTFREVLSLSCVNDDLKFKSNLLRCTAVQFIRTSRIDEALNYLYESRKTAEECSFDESIHMVESTFTSIYLQLKMYDKALEHQYKSLEIAEKLNIPGVKGYTYLGLGSCYYQLKDYSNSEKFLEKVFEDSNNCFTSVNTYYYLSLLNLAQGRLDKSFEYAEKGYQLASDNEIKDFKALCLGLKGRVILEKGEAALAISLMKEAIQIAEKLENKNAFFSLYRDLINAYAKINDYENQLKVYEKLYTTHTEYLEKQLRLKINQLNAEHQIELAQRNEELQKLKNVELKSALENVNRLNRELGRINQEKNDFMAVAVHDLKNPLQNILSTARLIKATSDPSEKNSLSDNIIYQTDRMFNLIRKLLDYNAIEQGKIKITNRIFSTESLSREIINDFKVAAEKKNIDIEYYGSPDDCYVNTDYDILYNIISNIMSNALKFSPPGKTVRFETFMKDDTVCFMIEDEGPGFTKEDMQKVFRKFSRLSAQPTGGEASTGLGLSIAKKLAELIDADIHLENRIQESGAKLTVVMKAVKLKTVCKEDKLAC
ncbi:MAG: tetratricopeptide repeat-containing sensor histidine kinase [Ignavibacteria bacterium]|nr:tetratricopeptide repeat-containing sensor histidine kinase [Ignavibacteria bacterium]